MNELLEIYKVNIAREKARILYDQKLSKLMAVHHSYSFTR